MQLPAHPSSLSAFVLVRVSKTGSAALVVPHLPVVEPCEPEYVRTLHLGKERQ